eukprot:3868895-Lingulodinium_polyedra.AAC.1
MHHVHANMRAHTACIVVVFVLAAVVVANADCQCCLPLPAWTLNRELVLAKARVDDYKRA